MSRNPLDPVIFRQIPVIHKIIQDETWLEGERRGCQVPSHDAVVRENVCRVILRIGQQMRDTIGAQLGHAAAETPSAVAARAVDREHT